MQVNGLDALVLPCIEEPVKNQPEYEHNICTFGCDGEVLVQVDSYSELITEAKVLPESRNYKTRIVNGSLQVILKPGDRVAVEINGRTDNDVFIFVNPLESGKPAEDDPKVRYFKAGQVYNAGTIGLDSGETVYIEGGAVVKGNISSTGASDVAVKGYGILDSRGNSSRGIQFNSPKNLTIDGITLLNDIQWSTLITQGDNIDIVNYKVVAVYNPENNTGCENDALDLLGCTNATVKGCFGYAHDDVFCVKSEKWLFKGKSDNILFEDCVAWNHRSGNSFIIGAEVNQDVSNVIFRNCVSIRSAGNPGGLLNRGGLSLHNCASGHISDILFENIVLEDCMEYGIHLDIRHSYVGNLGNGVEYAPGTCDGVTLRNIDIRKAPAKGNMAFGYDKDHRFTNVVFDNVCQEGVKIDKDNITDYFDPALKYVYKEQDSANLTNIEISFK